jgi:hypothetical protein
MISRRPNRRRSTETVPGPRRATAAAVVTTSIAGSGVLNRSGVGGGSNKRAMPAVPSATTALATGVRNPIRSNAPLASMAAPTTHISAVGLRRSVKYPPPWIIAVVPIATRSSSKPKAGHPPGKVENSRCRYVSFVLARCVGGYLTKLSLMGCVAKRIPRARSFLLPLSRYIRYQNKFRFQ